MKLLIERGKESVCISEKGWAKGGNVVVPFFLSLYSDLQTDSAMKQTQLETQPKQISKECVS